MKYYKSEITKDFTIYFAVKDGVVWHYINEWVKTSVPAEDLHLHVTTDVPMPLGRSLWIERASGRLYVFDSGVIKYWNMIDWTVSADYLTYAQLKNKCFQIKE